MKIKLLLLLLIFSTYAVAQCNCGEDESLKPTRIAISGDKCNEMPYKSIYHLKVKKGCKWYWGTASRVGTQHLITARHVINSRIWGNARKIKVYACNSNNPILTLTKQDFDYETKIDGDVRYLHITNRQKLNQLNLHSNGIYFTEMPASVSGTFVQNSVSNYPLTISMAGYACDPGNVLMLKQTQKYFINTQGIIGYYMYSCNGDSGAPLWIEKNGVYYLVGIHHGGVELGMKSYKTFDDNKLVVGTFLNVRPAENTRLNENVRGFTVNYSLVTEEDNKATPVSSNNVLFSAFRQGSGDGGKGNCASIAIIKAAIATFGINGVFAVQNHDENGYTIQLKSGETVSLTNTEYEQAALQAGYVEFDWNGIDDQGEEQRLIANYARLCFAVMAKMAMKYGDGKYIYNRGMNFDDVCGYATYSDALETLNSGFYTPRIYFLLGLDKYVYQYRNHKSAKKINSGITWSNKHAMYISNGYCDRYGRRQKLCKYPQSYGRMELFNTDVSSRKHNKKKIFNTCN